MSTEKDRDDVSGDPFADDNGNGREGRPGFVPEFVRKVAVAGLGALFMTEESVRSLAGQMKLPKEALTFLLSQAERTKDELGRVVSEELRRFLQSERLRDELRKLVSGTTVEIKAQIRLVPKDEADADASKVEISELRARRSKRTKRE